MYSSVTYTLYNVQGPVPTLFSEDPISTMENMKKEPAKLHWDLSKLYKVRVHKEISILIDTCDYMGYRYTRI
jgi:hypothetical protein